MSRTWSCASSRIASWAIFGSLVLGALPAGARELFADPTGDRYITLNTALKNALVTSAASASGTPASSTDFWRLRFDLMTRPAPWLETQTSYEQRVILETAPGTSGGSAFLPSNALMPFRLVPLAGPLATAPGFTYVHGFDRLFVGFRSDSYQIRIGRQALGFGRGTFFSAVDVLAPFGTFQVDREWKPGVDAVDAQFQLGELGSVGATIAAAPGMEDFVALARAQGYFGDVDALVIGGKRVEDWFVGLASSTQLLGAALSGEISYFATDGRGLDQPQVGDQGVFKGIFGASYSFSLLAGLTVMGEYHFNGFGIADLRRSVHNLFDPHWQRRFIRGDFQSIGQHELAVSGSLAVDENISMSTYSVVSPVDGSGMWAIGGSYSYSNNVSFDANLFVPFGAGLRTTALGLPMPGSEYGTSAPSGYVSIRFYD
jgi:hypothetical protein